MFKSKNDPLVDSVKKIMEENNIRRAVESQLNEELGITSKKALPFEMHEEYDRKLTNAINEALKGNQHKLDADKDGDIEADDLKDLRAKKNATATKKTFPNVKHTTKSGNPDWEKEGHPEIPTVKEAKKEIEEADTGFGDINMSPEMMDRVKMMNMISRLGYGQTSSLKPTNNTMLDRKLQAGVGSGLGLGAGAIGYQGVASALKEESEQVDEAAYSAKAARAGKDIGKPGKNFEKIAKSAEEKYGSKESGKNVAGAILKKIRAKKMEEETNHPLDEKTLTKAEMSKREELAKKMKKGDWSKRYGSRGKEVMYATATKMAKKLAEDVLEEIKANLGEEAFNAIMEAGMVPGAENANYGKGRTWGPVNTSAGGIGGDNVGQQLSPTTARDVTTNMKSPEVPADVQASAQKAMAPAVAAEIGAERLRAKATPAAKMDPNMAKFKAADAASMKNVNVADLNRIQKSNLSAFGKAFQTARSLQGIKSNEANPTAAATGKNFSFKGKEYGILRKDEKF